MNKNLMKQHNKNRTAHTNNFSIHIPITSLTLAVITTLPMMTTKAYAQQGSVPAGNSQGIGATAVGQRSQATANFATAVGYDAQATKASSTALGAGSRATQGTSTALGASSQAMGLDSTALGQGSQALEQNSTALGQGSQATKVGSTALGKSSNASGENATALGFNTTATGDSAIAIGGKASATSVSNNGKMVGAIAIGQEATANNSGIAIGHNTQATKVGSIALGQNAQAKGMHSTATGSSSNVSGNNSTANGYKNTISGNNSITVGTNNTVSGNDSIAAGKGLDVKSNSVVALGNEITVDYGFDNAVVLGHQSAATKHNSTPNIMIRNQQYNFAGATPTSTVSIGSTGKERQIVHVAAGRVTADSTDAINGSQLHAVVTSLNTIPAYTFRGEHGVTVDTTPNNGAMTQTVVVKGTKFNTQDNGDSYTITITQPDGQKQIITLRNGRDGAQGPKGDKGDIDQATKDKIQQSINDAKTANDKAVIADNKATQAQQTANTNAAKISKGLNVKTQDNKTTNHQLGDTITITGQSNISTNTEQGSVVVSLNDDITVKSVTVERVVADQVVIGPVSIAKDAGINAGGLTVQNVADGRIAPDSTDAVNGSQLLGVYNHIDERVFGIGNRIDEVEDRLQAGIAGNHAAMSLPQATLAGQSMVSVALGTYADKSAIAIGYSRLSGSGRVTLKSHLSADTKKKVGAGVGVGLAW